MKIVFFSILKSFKDDPDNPEQKFGPYGHGMICSFLAIFAALFAVSTHSEAGGACLSNRWALRCSILCSLVCSASASYGAYVSVTIAVLADQSPIIGTSPDVIDHLKLDVLHNEIAILQSCLYIECVLQEMIKTVS